MKICYIGNIGTHVKKFATSMRDEGHDVSLITFYSAEWNGIKIYNLGGRTSYLSKWLIPITAFRINKLVKKIKPDILHAHYVFPYGLYGSLSGFHPLIISGWGSDILINIKKSRIIKYLTKFALSHADLIHSVSEQITKGVISLGINEEKIFTVPIGVELDKFNPQVDGSEIRRKLKWENNPIVISVRHLEPLYNVELLIKTIPKVVKEDNKVRFIIAGEGSQERYLKNLAKELGVDRYIKFTGFVDHEKLPEYLACADVYVSTSRSDSLGVSNLEAMACGTFPILTDIPIARYWIKHGENGFLTPVDKPNKLAKFIVKALNDQNLKEEAVTKNYRIVKEKASLRLTTIKFENIYSELKK
jgi:glycosyltransferase involved in cell wall biosynthesis